MNRYKEKISVCVLSVVCCFLIISCFSISNNNAVTMPYYSECENTIEEMKKANASPGVKIEVVPFSHSVSDLGNMRYWRPATGYIKISGSKKRTERMNIVATSIASGCYPWGGVEAEFREMGINEIFAKVRRLVSEKFEYFYLYFDRENVVLLYNPELRENK